MEFQSGNETKITSIKYTVSINLIKLISLILELDFRSIF